MDAKQIAGFIRNVPDFPKPGIQFKDITTLLQNGEALVAVVDHLADRYREKKIDVIVGIEARGFIFGAALAYALKTAFVMVRKPGKLPAKTRRVTYDLEYGTDAVEIHEDAIQEGQNVLIIDDLLATGGTVGIPATIRVAPLTRVGQLRRDLPLRDTGYRRASSRECTCSSRKGCCT